MIKYKKNKIAGFLNQILIILLYKITRISEIFE